MKTIRNHYKVTVPGDCADTLKDLGSIAINEARERARLYCLPATWTAIHQKGNVGGWNVTFNVYRWHYKGE